MLIIALTLALALPVPIDLDTISIDHARTLHGRRVLATFLPTKPPHLDRGTTTIGAADGPDGSERGAQLRGRRFDVREGQRLEVMGRLRVTDWPAVFVGGVLVPGWVGVTVQE